MPLRNETIFEPVPALDFEQNPPAFDQLPGRVFWDAANHTLAVMISAGVEPVTLQVGQEQHAWVRNDTGSDVPNGTAIVATGSVGYKLTFVLAQANAIATSVIHGITTQPIPKNEEGVACTFGVINDIDTQTPGWAEGDVLYLSATVPGGLQTTPPASGYTVAAGIVLRRHVSQGQIMIKPWPRPGMGDMLGGNYTGFAFDGTMRAVGNATCWRDELQSIVGTRVESPAADIQINQAEGSYTFKTSARYPTDYVVTNHQLNHDWELGTVVEPHLHWWQVSAATPNWLVAYRWQKQLKDKTTAWALLPWVSDKGTWVANPLNQITDFGGITPPVGYGQVSDIVQLKLYRDVTNASGLFAGADPEAADVDGVNFDSHIEVDMLGSEQEYSKYV